MMPPVVLGESTTWKVYVHDEMVLSIFDITLEAQ